MLLIRFVLDSRCSTPLEKAELHAYRFLCPFVRYTGRSGYRYTLLRESTHVVEYNRNNLRLTYRVSSYVRHYIWPYIAAPLAFNLLRNRSALSRFVDLEGQFADDDDDIYTSMYSKILCHVRFSRYLQIELRENRCHFS